MNLTLTQLLLTILFTLGAPAPDTRAQSQPATPPSTPTTTPISTPTPTTSPQSAGLVNDWLRKQSPAATAWDLGGQLRARFEHKEHFAAPGLPGAVDFKKNGGNADNTYLLLREKIHLGYTPADWIALFAEARDSSSQNDDRTPNPESDRFDLHQAFALVGNKNQFPLTAKIGRQELNYGDERLVGAFDWSNVGRVFDAAKARFENPQLWLDAFVGRVVLVDDNSFNEPNDYDIFSGLYASSKNLCPKQETQAYFLARNVSAASPTAIGAGLPPALSGASPRDIYTLGLRLKSLPGALGAWDYSAEFAGQLGRFNDPLLAGGTSLDHEAFAFHAGAGYTCKSCFATPRLGLEYNFASGDDNPTDGTHGTFENLFPTNHKFYGYMDFVSWQNIHNPRLNLTLKPHQKITVTTDFHAFWLADDRDYFYQVNGSPRATGGYGLRSDAGKFVGSELDLVINYALKPYASAQAGYGHFFVGDYPKDSLAAAGGATDADYLYLQFLLNF